MNLALAAALGTGVDVDLDAGLACCEQLLGRHLDTVARRFGAAGIGIIDLPSLGPEPIVAAHVQACASLYVCRELDAAGILATVEALATSIERGEDGLTITWAASLFRPFGARAYDRFMAAERAALYARVLPPDVDELFARLLEALDALARASPLESLVPLRVRVGVIAIELGRQLSDRGVGFTAFAARDIVEQIREALAVLANPEVAAALGGGRPLTLIARHGPRLLGRALDIERHLARARHGVEILAWIAMVAPEIQAAAARLGPSDAIVLAASALRVHGGAA